MKNNSSDFMDLLHNYLASYLPDAIGASKNTIISYKYAFRLLFKFMYTMKGVSADTLSFDMLNYQMITDYLRWLETERQCSSATKNQRLSALLSFSEYAQNRNFEAATVFRTNLIKIPIKKARHKPRAVFTADEVSILLSLPDESTQIGLRNKVLLSFMYASGARAQEVCDLTVGDLSFANDRSSVVLHGKGGKTRRISIPIGCSKMLEKYLDFRKLCDKPTKYVFFSQTHEHMSISCIEEIFKKYTLMAKKQYPKLFNQTSYPPHSMRHTTASHMLEAGVSIMIIKNFLGHASIQSTQIYAELSQNTIDKHLRDWNEKWFSHELVITKKGNTLPDFLKI